ncbi:MAG TPA: hypothetical protein VNP02_10840 [Gammaproteobacteria bacterium]|nr:hypothetical protein [Gammaproteobacteria bacterium]
MTAIVETSRGAAYAAPVNSKLCDRHDPHTSTVVLPPDELAIRRERKRLGQLTPLQIQRLLVAAELRRRATEGECDD